MKKSILFLLSPVLGVSLLAQQTPPAKVGIIHIQNAMISTKEGQKAAAELQARFDPTRKRLEAKQGEIASLQSELSKGSNTIAEERRLQLTRDIDQKTRALNRDTEDAQAEFQVEQDKVLQQLGQRMMAVIDKYSRDNGYTLVLDVSSPQTPVLFAANGIDITQEIIALYDRNAQPPAASETKPAPAAPPVKPVSAPAKKQP